MKKSIVVIVAFIVLFIFKLEAQTLRNNYKAKFEINDVVLHGAGQSSDAFEQYYELMPENNKPIIYMAYFGLENMNDKSWGDKLRLELDKYTDQLTIPQIGLSMTSDGSPHLHYEGDVATGLYDEQIKNLVAGLKNLGRPVFLRIGFEFNGMSWNGYLPNTYKSAFKRIVDEIKKADIEVATVWCFAVDGNTNFMDYYPGDNYVDWWAIDPFSNSHFSKTVTKSFMNKAHLAGKPVMIGETTPRNIGADNDSDWNNWFKQYFDFIYDNPGVKATCYINWNWNNYSQWSSWGNAQLGNNDFVTINYIHNLRDSIFLHGGAEKDIRTLFGYNDNTPPEKIEIQNHSAENVYPVSLSWKLLEDESGIAHYSVYKNGEFYGALNDTSFTDISGSAEETYELQISSVDRAGNESQLSDAFMFELGDTISKAINDNFELNNKPWLIQNYEGAEANDKFENGEATITITKTTGTNWHSQFIQLVKISAGNKYKVEIEARASKNTFVDLILQQNHAPYQMPIAKGLTLTTENQTFTSNPLTSADDDFMNVGIFAGKASVGTTIIISRISFYEIKGNDIVVEENILPTADAGEDLVYTNFQKPLSLDGTKSFDNDGTIKSYKWEQLSGEKVLAFRNSDSKIAKVSGFLPGSYLFRLIVSDDKGGIAIDEVQVIAQEFPTSSRITELSENEIEIYPNPASTKLLISIHASINENVSMSLVDVNGKQIQIYKSQSLVEGINNINLNMSSIKPGFYILKFKSSSFEHSQKIIIK